MVRVKSGGIQVLRRIKQDKMIIRGGEDVYQINNVLEKLSENTDAIQQLLEEYGYDNIKINPREMRFARGHGSGLNISIKLDGNPACIVKDFVTNEANNIINFIMAQRSVSFRDVLQSIKKILKLDDLWQPRQRYKLFNGIYENIGRKNDHMPKTYGEDILNQYQRQGNLLWLRDGISLEVQHEFSICFDVVNNAIVVPWRNQFGEIIAIKNRVNGIPEDGMSKYYYSTGGLVSTALYGYSENFSYIQNTDLFLGESEKQVLQLAAKGYRNALSLGSNSLSRQQAALILSLNPKRIIWLLDEGLPKENTLKNAQVLKEYCTMRTVEQYWWNWENSLRVPSGSKMSPGDCSKEVFENILKYELENLEEEDEI